MYYPSTIITMQFPNDHFNLYSQIRIYDEGFKLYIFADPYIYLGKQNDGQPKPSSFLRFPVRFP